MIGQMSIYDYIQTYDPVRDLARRLVKGDGKTTVRNRLRSCMESMEFWRDVQREFCPYGCAGMRSHSELPTHITGYDMAVKNVDIVYNDEDIIEKHITVGWKEVADAIRKELEE